MSTAQEKGWNTEKRNKNERNRTVNHDPERKPKENAKNCEFKNCQFSSSCDSIHFLPTISTLLCQHFSILSFSTLFFVNLKKMLSLKRQNFFVTSSVTKVAIRFLSLPFLLTFSSLLTSITPSFFYFVFTSPCVWIRASIFRQFVFWKTKETLASVGKEWH